jgi:hypothetical protein
MSINSNPTASQENMKKLLVSKYFSFITGVVDTGFKPLLSNISNNKNGPNEILRGPGGNDS